MKPQVQGDVQGLPLGSQVVTAIQGRPVSTSTPQIGDKLVWNGTTWVPGGNVGFATRTANVATAGTTFGTGADLLASDISFTANGSLSYIVRVSAASWQNTLSGGANFLYLKYDGAQAGEMAVINCPGVSFNVPFAVAPLYLITPAAGTHTVNLRLVVNSGTGTVVGGAGGAANAVPITVTIDIK